MSSDGSASPEARDTSPQKRKASTAGLDSNGTTRAVKRRASKACQCCRARKVRCNVTEHGAPCTNCRLDEVECIVSESRRKKKWNKDGEANAKSQNATQSTQGTDVSIGSKANGRKLASRASISYPPASAALQSHDLENAHLGEHIPHSIYRSTGQRLNTLSFQSLSRRLSLNNGSPNQFAILQESPISTDGHYFSPSLGRVSTIPNLPYYIKALPPKIGPEEIAYLEKKGALSIPSTTLRNELLRAYIEFVHPYMPLLELYDFLMIIESGDGSLGKISLILFQAVMFAGSAFIDMKYLNEAGYDSRKQARKDFFQKTRLLYDFDYESDRVSLVQALLILTYYYETPDDQKDTWHWMGVATSVAHTIGLHRNPERSNMDAKRTKLWKRIWWSTYMRDRLIALGMRRPTRIKAEDYDVPMITIDDFELVAIPETVTCVPLECKVARDVDKQRELAIMCIEKAKLCLCISHVLSKQYCVLNNNQGMVNDRTTMMLLPKKLDPETCEVKACDEELQKWLDNLSPEAQHRETFTGDASIDLCRSLLHMVFYTTLSALHRPQVLPAVPAGPGDATNDLLECSRRNVRRAATAITSIAQALDAANLVKYLPTTGVTVLLPAIIIHLLDIKSPEEVTRRNSLRGFCKCMHVMSKLRDIYAAADYSTAFLEAAIRKAGIQLMSLAPRDSLAGLRTSSKVQPITTVEDLVDAGRRLDMVQMAPPNGNSNNTLTPPPDPHSISVPVEEETPVTDEEVARRLETFLASTPPGSDNASEPATLGVGGGAGGHGNMGLGLKMSGTDDTTSPFDTTNDEDYKLYATAGDILPEFEQDAFEALINSDAMGETAGWSFDDGGIHGFTVDMDWMSVNGAGAEMGAATT